MIGQLRGQLIQKRPNDILIDVQGVGYEVYIPLTTFFELPGEGSEVALKIHTHVREDALTLFGFLTQREKDFFLKLISISGIGPKLAVGILSGARVEELAQAVAEGNLPRLTAIPGALEEDVVSALVNLGYPRAAAEKALSTILRSPESGRTFEDILRSTLRLLAG
jgi:Holliday junction DNA helicase RuvA